MAIERAPSALLIGQNVSKDLRFYVNAYTGIPQKDIAVSDSMFDAAGQMNNLSNLPKFLIVMDYNPATDNSIVRNIRKSAEKLPIIALGLTDGAYYEDHQSELTQLGVTFVEWNTEGLNSFGQTLEDLSKLPA